MGQDKINQPCWAKHEIALANVGTIKAGTRGLVMSYTPPSTYIVRWENSNWQIQVTENDLVWVWMPTKDAGGVAVITEAEVIAWANETWQEKTKGLEDQAAARWILAQCFDKQRFDDTRPCYLCGYNGESYYQPTMHACATLYHKQETIEAQLRGAHQLIKTKDAQIAAYERRLAAMIETANNPLPDPKPVPIRLHCPECGGIHVDVGEFATKVHHTHACQHCGMVWRPAVVPTVGVEFLPGFKNDYDPRED